jgi:hypothetical protein
MASYQPPSENLPIFDNSVFTATNGSTTGGGTGSGLTLAQANALYLRKTYPDICTALETFSAGISTTFITSSGDITGPIVSNSLSSVLSSDTVNLYNNLINGVLNIGTNARTANMNIGTGQTNNQLSIGSSNNTQTNIYGGTIYLGNNTSVSGTLGASGVLSGGSLDLGTTGDITSCRNITTLRDINCGRNIQCVGFTSTALATLSGGISCAGIACSGDIDCYSGAPTFGNIRGQIIYAYGSLGTAGAISGAGVTCTSLTTSGGTLTCGALTSTSVSAGSGSITTLGNITCQTLTVTSSGVSTGISASFVYSPSTSGNLSIATNQTTGDLFIGNGNRQSTASIFIGTGSTGTNANIIQIGSTGNTYASVLSLYGQTTLYGTTTIAGTGTLTCTTGTGSIKCNILTVDGSGTQGIKAPYYDSGGSTVDTYVGFSQTSGKLFIGTGARTAAGIIYIGTGSTVVNDIQIGSTDLTNTFFSTLKLIANTTLSGTLTMGTKAIVSVGNITSTGNITGTFTGTVNGGSITGTSLTLGTGAIVSVGNITSSGNITGTFTGTVNGGSITGTSLTLGTGAIVSVGNITSSGNITGTFTGTTNGGTITGTSLTLGTGAIVSVGNITSSGNITGTFTGTVNGGSITGTSLTLGTGAIVSVGNITSSGVLTINTLEGSASSSSIALYDNLTNGTINLCTNTTHTGAINIGTGNTSAALGITLGNSLNPVTVGGNLTVNGTLSCASFAPASISINTITSTGSLPDNVNFYNNQTSGILNIGVNAGRTGAINIGTGSTGSTSNINIGNLYTTVTIGTTTNVTGNLVLYGAIRVPSGTSNMVIIPNQTSGICQFCDNTDRTGALSIYTNAVSATSDVSIGSLNTAVSIGGNLKVNNAIASSATTNATLYDDQTSGTLSIGGSTTRTGAINIGVNSTTTAGGINIGNTNAGLNVNGPSRFFSLLAMQTTAGISLVSGDIGMTNGAITLTNGSVTTTNGNILTQAVRAITQSTDINIASNQQSGILYIGHGPLRVSNIFIGAQAAAGTLTLGSSVMGVTCTNTLSVGNALTATGGVILGTTKGITCGTAPPTLTNTSLNYFYNYPSQTTTGIVALTGVGTYYNPITNTAGGANFFKAGIYTLTLNTQWRYTGSPTAYNSQYTIGMASGTTTGTVTTSTVTDISIIPTMFGQLLTGGNNYDTTQSHTYCFTLSVDSFVNIFYRITSLAITSGSMNLTTYGNIRRIG